VNALSGLFGFGLLQEKHELVWQRCFGNVAGANDCNGLWVNRSAYGDKNSPFGWELDHIVPKALGGSDDVSNLRPRHCSGNRSAGAILGNALNPRGGLF
jgi:hypothetical protein